MFLLKTGVHYLGDISNSDVVKENNWLFSILTDITNLNMRRLQNIIINIQSIVNERAYSINHFELLFVITLQEIYHKFFSLKYDYDINSQK